MTNRDQQKRVPAADPPGSLPAQPVRQRRYHFDRFGSYFGYIDEVGRYFDKDGVYHGAVSESGAFFDEHGACCGHIDVLGQYWNETGTFCGYFRSPSPASPRSAGLRQNSN